MTDEALRAQVRILRGMRWPDARILQKFTKHGMTAAHFTEPVQAPDPDHPRTHTGEPHA